MRVEGGELLASQNLSDLFAPAVARANLGVNLRLTQSNAKLQAISAGTVARWKWLNVGDSYTGKLYLGIQPALLAAAGRLAGGGFYGTHSGAITTNATTGTVTEQTAAFDAWPSGITHLFSTGASRTYGMGGSTVVADTWRVYYVKEPGAGTFKIQIDGVDAVGFTNVSASGTLGQLGVATISTTLAAHALTVVNLTGTHRVVGVVWENSTVAGLMPMAIGQAGIPLNSATASATGMANLQAFLANELPDVMTLEMKEDSSYYASALSTLFTTTQAGAPLMDVVGIGSPPIASNDADQVIQNGQLRDACRTYGYAFFDSYSIYGSYAKLTALGYNGDGTHVSTACDQDRGAELLRQTGLLGAYGRTIFEGLVKTPKLTFGRATDAAVGSISAETSFGLDFVIRHLNANRWIEFRGSTDQALARIAETAGVSWFPDYLRVGDAAAPALKKESANMIGVRQGGVLGNQGDFSARAYTSQPQSVSVSGSVTIDASAGSVILATLTGNVTSWVITNSASGQLVEVHFIQDATGSRTITGANASIKLAGGALTLTTTATKRDVVILRNISGGLYEVGRSMNIAA